MTYPSPYRISVDPGGTKTEVVVLDPNARPLLRERNPTPRSQEDEYGAILDNTANLVKRALAKTPSGEQATTIGIGIPGILDAETGRVINANMTCLIGQTFRQDLVRVLGRPVAMENHAECFTLAESLQSSGRGYDMVFGAIMGTGVGGGLCFNSTIYSGRYGIAGEWGHMSGRPRRTTLFLGKSGLCGNAHQRAQPRRRLQGCFRPIPIGTRGGVSKVRRGDPDCRSVFNSFLDAFGRCMGSLISLLDPDVIVLGGGLSNIDALYREGAEMARFYAFHPNPQTPILKNQLGDSVGVFGAAWIGGG